MLQPIKILATALLLLCVMGACKDYPIQPQTGGGAQPAPVSNVQVINTPGGANLVYQLPKDESLLYVKGTFETNGEKREAKASYFTDTLVVDGFTDTLAHEIKLYAISRTEVASTPVSVTIHPKLPPVMTVAHTIQLTPDFGGIRVSYTNPTNAALAIIVLADTGKAKQRVNIGTEYTDKASGNFAVRGLDSVPIRFGVVLRDHWDHFSDTVYQTLTPIYEKQLDKSLFQAVTLPTDQKEGYGWDMSNMWNNSLDGDGWHTEEDGSVKPGWFTFDLGVTAQLSRFKFWQRSGDYLYTHGNPHEFEIWGSTAPAPDGSFNGWTRLDSCTSIKPSGSPLGVVTDADRAYADAGEEFTFPNGIPKVRYLRFKTIKNWSGTTFVHIMEITFWGSTK